MKQTLLGLAVLFSIGLTQNQALASNAEYIVKLQPAHARMPSEQLQILGLDVTGRIPQLDMVFSKTKPNLARAEVASAILYVVPNYHRQIDLYSTGLQKNESLLAPVAVGEAGLLYSMRQIKAEGAWEISKGSRSVVMAISDTGAFPHLELVPNFWRNPGETGVDSRGKDKTKNKVDDDGNGFVDDYQGASFLNGYSNRTFDRHYHGTHVSGIAGAYAPDKTGVVGPVWETSLMEVPFIDSNGSGTDDDAMRTIVYAADNGARVLNASWGGSDDSQALRDAIEYAGKKGVLLVFAAGNDGENTDKHPHYPSAIDSPYIVSVAATNSSAQLAGFSNYGLKSVDLGAPGDDIYSSFNPQCNCIDHVFYNRLSGTSMAAPLVTGAAALMYSINPKLTNLEVKAILLSTVTPSKELAGKSVSGGILNLTEAAKLAQKTLQ